MQVQHRNAGTPAGGDSYDVIREDEGRVFEIVEYKAGVEISRTYTIAFTGPSRGEHPSGSPRGALG
jgi:hypothetical protein